MMGMKTTPNTTTSFPLVRLEDREEAVKILQEAKAYLEDGTTGYDTENLYRVVELLFPENSVVPPRKSLDSRIEDLGLEVEYIDDDVASAPGALAYVYRAYNGSYRVYLNPMASENEKRFMDLHEKGHVVYNHLNDEIDKAQFKKAISSQFSKVKEYFSDTVLKKKSEDDLVEYLYWKLANVAKDMEINSKQFSDDWAVAKTTLSRVTAEINLATCDVPKKQKQFVAGLLREVETGENKWFCHPENYPGLWPGMDWIVYMKYLVSHVEDTVKKIAMDVAGMTCEDDAKGEDGKSSKGKIGDDDVNEAKADEERGKDEGPQEFPEEEFDTNEDFEEGGSKSGGGHNVVMAAPTSVTSMEDLARIIQRHSYSYEKRFLRTDVLYNSNRNKHTGVVIPRRHYTRKVYPGAMQFLVDVSGSVNISLVEACIKTIKETISFDKKNSHVVCWDTHLCADFTLDGPISIPRGGDNKCVRGVEYIVERYIKRPDAKLYFISDGGDYLWEICQAAKKANCYRYYIEYKYRDTKFFEQDWSNMDASQQSEFMKIFECFQVDGQHY